MGSRGVDSAGERPRKVRAWVVRGARGRRLGPSRPSGIGCSLSPASRDPRSPSPAHTRARAWSGERGPGGRRREGEGGSCTRLARCGARAARSRRPRRHLFPLRPSVCRWLCPSAAPPLGSLPSAWPAAAPPPAGPGPGEPGLAGPSRSPGPIVRRSVCPEAGPRDPERCAAPRRRVKGPPTPSLRGRAKDAGRRPSVFCLSASGEGSRGSLRPGGRGQPRLRPSPLPRFPESRRVPASSPPVTPLSAPLAREGRRCSRPPRWGPGRLGRERPGRPRRLTGWEEQGEGGWAWEGRPGSRSAPPSPGQASKFRPRRRLCGLRVCPSRCGRPTGFRRIVPGNPPGSPCQKPKGPSRLIVHTLQTEPK